MILKNMDRMDSGGISENMGRNISAGVPENMYGIDS
jgi:hypothetical protein